MIHGGNPFLDDPDQRDPVRRFRGRLAAPVTIVTAGSGDTRTGLTVSSLNVIEGEPGVVQMVVGPTTDLWSTARDSGRFVVHVCRDRDQSLAGVFAGMRPSPGGTFAGVTVVDTQWGPVIDGLPDRAYCRYIDRIETGYAGVLSGEIDEVEVGHLDDPLVYFRGGYRSLK